MMSEEIIRKRLSDLGLNEREAQIAMRNVGEAVFGGAAEAYLETLPESKREQVAAFAGEEAMQYIVEHAGEFPPFPQSAFDAIHDSVWEDYFKAVA